MARPCTVCDHPKRKAIESALASGETNRAIAALYALSEDAVSRHKSKHLAKVMAETAKPITRRLARTANGNDGLVEVTEIAHADRLVDQVGALGRRAEALLEQVEAGGTNDIGETVVDFKAGASLIREIRGCLELQAKLLGELQAAAMAKIHANPHWIELRTAIVEELSDDPVTLAKFAAAVRRAQQKLLAKRRG